MTNRRTVLGALSATAISIFAAGTANAADYTFNFHGFLPAPATIPAKIIDVWADKIQADSGDKIEIKRFPSMQLGGRPPELLDQVIDGVVDMTYTVVGYTPGRFPQTEVFELPFMVTDSRAASSAYWKMFEKNMQDDFKDVKILGTWVHGPGVIHANKPVETPDDMAGLKVRAPSRLTNALMAEMGATAVGMPVPAIPEALSKGVVDGAVIPWEVTRALKIPELVENHTEFEGKYFYTVTFVLAMNKDKWDALPEDMQKVIMDNSGHDFSVFAADVMTNADGPSRELALDAGNNIVTISESNAQVWAEKAQPVYDNWLSEMTEKGIDGQALIDEAKSLMDAYGS